MTVFNIFNGSYKSQSPDSNYQELINMRLIDAGMQARGRYCVIPSAGSVELTDLGGNICRGIIKVGDYWYVVRDNKVYKLYINIMTETCESTILLGTIGTTTGSVKFAYNATQLLIVDGSSSGYIVTLSTGAFATIADGDFQGGSSVVFLDGYFVYSPTDTAFLKSSSLDDGTAWDAADVASAEADPDNIVAMKVSRGEIWVFGEKSTEIWFDDANAEGLPFSPRIGLGLSIGCSAPDSVASINDSLIWLDNRGFIVQSTVSNYLRNQSSGYALNQLSDDALQAEISSYSTISDAIGCQILEGGKLFYQITFPTEHKTWVCDLSLVGNKSGLSPWYQRGVFSSYYGTVREHMLQYTDLVGQTVVGCGITSGKIYLLKQNSYTDDGLPIHRLMRSAPIHSEGNLIECSKLELRMSTGYANPTDEGSDPKIMMRYSGDGHSWSNEIERSIGTTGEYNKPIIWSNLGSLREWRFELSIVAPIYFSIIELSANMDADPDE